MIMVVPVQVFPERTNTLYPIRSVVRNAIPCTVQDSDGNNTL